jgi:pentatricopeptide repeat protein
MPTFSLDDLEFTPRFIIPPHRLIKRITDAYKKNERQKIVDSIARVKFLSEEHEKIEVYTNVFQEIFRQGNYDQLRDFINQMADVAQMVPPPEFHKDIIVAYRALIKKVADNAATSGKIPAQILREAENLSVELSEDVYRDAVILFGRKALVRDLLRTLDKMRQKGFELDQKMYGSLLAGMVRRANSVRPEILLDSIRPDPLNYNLQVLADIKAGGTEHAYTWMKTQELLHGIQPDYLNLSAVFHGYCAEDKIYEAEDLILEMEKLGFTPDPIIRRTMIRKYCEKGMLMKARTIIREMLASRRFVDSVTLSILLEACIANGKPDWSRQVIEIMLSAGYNPDPSLCCRVISLFIQNLNFEKSYRVLKIMQMHNIPPDRPTCIALVDFLSQKKRWDEVLDTMSVMRSFGVDADIVCYTNVIDKMCRDFQLSHAFALLRAMFEKKMRPDILTCNRFLLTCCLGGELKLATRTIDLMTIAGIDLEEVCYVDLVNQFYQKDGSLKPIEKVLIDVSKKMKKFEFDDKFTEVDVNNL